MIACADCKVCFSVAKHVKRIESRIAMLIRKLEGCGYDLSSCNNLRRADGCSLPTTEGIPGTIILQLLI